MSGTARTRRLFEQFFLLGLLFLRQTVPDAGLVHGVVREHDAHRVPALLTLRVFVGRGMDKAEMKQRGLELAGLPVFHSPVLLGTSLFLSLRKASSQPAKEKRAHLEHDRVSSEQLQALHGVGVQGDHGVVVVHSVLHNQAIGRLLALHDGGGKVFLSLLLACGGSGKGKKRARRESVPSGIDQGPRGQEAVSNVLYDGATHPAEVLGWSAMVSGVFLSEADARRKVSVLNEIYTIKLSKIIIQY
jgi:hypothetical protein